MARLTTATEVRPARDRRELEGALAVRHAVFCQEQGVSPDLDRDDRDDEALHLVAVRDDRVVGTCRLLLEPPVAKLGRLAVAAECRRQGIGAALVAAARDRAGAAGARRIVLSAQTHATGVYAAQGFTVRGEPFQEAGIEHVRMEHDVA
jgi:putative N-acetyltransferase (TIGR04045 family)